MIITAYRNYSFTLQLNHEEEDPDEEAMGVAETYAEYWPAKCELN